MATERTSLFIFFGGTGDLAYRKLYPSMYNLYKRGTLRDHFAVIGTSRNKLTDEQFQNAVRESLGTDKSDQDAENFISHFAYEAHDVTDKEHYQVLRDRANELDEKYNLEGNRIFYLSLAPSFFGTVAGFLKTQGLMDTSGFNRLVIEKPFGRDYDSASQLNDALSQSFQEEQIFRIDHYLGKEMIQNIEALRFGNTIVESLWNNRYIDNIQVTLSEELGVEERAAYYDNSGALRDMVQNHIMQIVSLLAMEQPVAFTDVDIRAEKVKALRSLRVYNVADASTNFVRGQYGPGENGRKEYRQEDNVPHDSNNETFVAGKLLFDNYRWSGTPFYIRTGKELAGKFTRIDVVFKKPLVDIFAFPQNANAPLEANVLTIYIEPKAGFSLRLNGKTSGQGFQTMPVNLDYFVDAAGERATPEPYERLIHDVMKGDGTNFSSWPEVSYAWKFVDQIRKVWDLQQPNFPNYTPGSMGPAAAEELIRRDHREWVYRLNN